MKCYLLYDFVFLFVLLKQRYVRVIKKATIFSFLKFYSKKSSNGL